MSMVEMLDMTQFNERYENWSTPNYWEAVIEMQAIAVLNHEVYVYGNSTSRRGTRWYLALRPDGDRRR
jgi:hypothetical protein